MPCCFVSAGAGQRHFYGLNIAGAEFAVDPYGGGANPGTYGTDYTWPPNSDVDGMFSAGFNIVRLPFRWERVRPTSTGSFNAAELGRMDSFVSHATAAGLYVLLDMHNYAIYGHWPNAGTNLGAEQTNFAQTWAAIASRYVSNPRVMFGLMNEPKDTDQMILQMALQAGIDAIRGTGAKQPILVEGNGWASAQDYATNCWYGFCDTVLFHNLTDTANNLVLDAHNYFSTNSYNICTLPTLGVDQCTALVAWCRTNGVRLFISEFYFNTGSCRTAGISFLQYVKENLDVFMGWTFWAGMSKWPAGDVSPIHNLSDDRIPIMLNYASL